MVLRILTVPRIPNVLRIPSILRIPNSPKNTKGPKNEYYDIFLTVKFLMIQQIFRKVQLPFLENSRVTDFSSSPYTVAAKYVLLILESLAENIYATRKNIYLLGSLVYFNTFHYR